MIHATSDSDITSLDSSSPRSSKRPAYYVQSPRDSNDGYKSSSLIQATPPFNSPMESPPHPSYSRHSRISSDTQSSGTLMSFIGRKWNRKRNYKGWTDFNVIDEEDDIEELNRDKGLSRKCQVTFGLVGLVSIFSVFCLISWAASKPYNAHIALKRFTVHNFYYGEGSDTTGVPTKILTTNCSVLMSVYNPASFFGIDVNSTPLRLKYSDITIATGRLEKYYQPRKSHRTISINLQGIRVPLYGAGVSLAASDLDHSGVSMTLKFEVRARGNIVGKLVKTTHRRHIFCSISIDLRTTKSIILNKANCTYS